MGAFINLFPVIAAGGNRVKISRKGKAAIESLNTEGQIDHDKLRQPIVLKVIQNMGLDQIYVLRNNTVQCVTVNPRGGGEPQVTWDTNDGYRRPVSLRPEPNNHGTRRERQRRTMYSQNPYMDAVLGGSNV